MREIKFRVWSKEHNEFVSFYWLDLYFSEQNGLIYSDGINVTDKFTLQQYTGLKDKNNKGKEIFEGNIVEFNNCNYLRTGGYLDDEILRGKVIFAYGGWMIKTNKGDYDLYQSIFNDEELEVIGNIYEHPYLLEEQNG